LEEWQLPEIVNRKPNLLVLFSLFSLLAILPRYQAHIPGAIAKATRTFIKGLDRKQRFDVNKSGLEIKAIHIGSGNAATKSSGADERANQTE
jgi:hypothetical protein